MDGHGTNWRRNIAEKFQSPESGAQTLQTTDRQTDGRQTDGRPMTYSEHELEFTFAKNLQCEQ